MRVVRSRLLQYPLDEDKNCPGPVTTYAYTQDRDPANAIFKMEVFGPSAQERDYMVLHVPIQIWDKPGFVKRVCASCSYLGQSDSQ